MPGYLKFALVSLFVFLLSQSPDPGYAGSEKLTRIGHSFERCMKKQSRRVYAWAPGTYSYCFWRVAGSESDQKEAVSRCQKGMSKEARKHSKCKLAFDGKKIVDPFLKDAMTKYPKVPVEMEIFDKETGKKQKVSAEFVRFPHSNPKTTPFHIRTSKNVFCEGSFTVRAVKMDFNVRCFDEKWKGTSKAKRLNIIKNGGWVEPFPAELVLERDGSYIRLRY